MTLGIDMQADWPGDLLTEPSGQILAPQRLVAVVDTPQGGVLSELVDQVPEVVQQCRDHDRVRRPGAFREMRALQRMLKLADGFVSILRRAASLQNVQNPVRCRHGPLAPA